MAGKEKRGKGRPRKRGREEHSDEETWEHSISLESSKDEDFVPSPTFSRYPTRYSRAVVAQSSTLRSPVRNVTRSTRRSSRLNPGVRVVPNQEAISRNGDNAMPELQHCTSKQTHEDLISHAPATPDENTLPIRKDNNTKRNVDKSVTAESLNWSAPISEHVMDQLDNLIFHKLTSQSRGPQEQLNYVDVEGRLEKSTTNFVGGNSQCLSRTHSISINVTEFAKRLHDDDMDDDPDEEEVESALEPGFVFVNEHKVKAEIAPLLRRVFDKYGDVTAETNLASSNSLSHFLQQLCHVYEQLERTKFIELTRTDLDAMIADVRDCERVKLDVGWLREKLEYISQTWTSYKQYFSLKEELGKYDVSIGSLEKELHIYKSQVSDIQRKICAGEEELEAKRAKAKRTRNVVRDTKGRVKTLGKQNLVDGLL